MVSSKDSKKRVYKSNYLTNVVVRVDFPKILELEEKKPPSKFQNKISEEFPIVEDIERRGIELTLDRDQEDLSYKHEVEIFWKFTNREKNQIILVDSTHVSVEFLKYENFEDFFKTVKFIYETFIELYPVKISTRIGLRYINQITVKSGNPLDWSGLIHPSLFSITKEFTSEEDNILRSLHLLELKEDDYQLRFQFGLFNSEYPNKVARKEFVLDYDCMTNDEMDIGEISKKVKEFNKVIDNWFERSILDDLRKMMGAENDE